MPVILNKGRDVSIKILFPLDRNKITPVFNGKNQLDVNLRVCISHVTSKNPRQ